MRIGVLGTGKVGQALGNGFLGLGHEVKMGSRDAQHPRMLEWVTRSGPRASGGTFAEAAAFGGLIVLATLGVASEQCLTQAGLKNFRDKVVIDTTNPPDVSQGAPRLAVGHTDSH
jgi:predicted dinucleotide-binding enzyme